MKASLRVLALIILAVGIASAQSVGDYRSTTPGGSWNSVSSWEQWNGSAWVVPSGPPTGGEAITVLGTDSINVNIPVQITGTLVNQGRLTNTTNLTIKNGGTFDHAQNNGSLPLATWESGSTCRVTGYISGAKPNNLNQNFHHLVWACPGQTVNVDMGLTGATTIGGDLTVDTTGFGRVYLTSPSTVAGPINIAGNVYVRGGQFASNGSSSLATIVVNVQGNISLTGGNFGVSRGSGPDVTFNLFGDLTVTNATLQNSGAARVNKLVFVGTDTQKIVLSNVTYATGTGHFTMEVAGGSTVDLDSSVVSASNTGSFIVAAGGALATGHPGGLSGTVLCTGTSNGGGNSFSTQGNYIFNGTTAQVTSALMPPTVNNLVINNPAGVGLSQPTTINGVLRLMAGVFDNTIPFMLGPTGSISFEGGSLLVPLSVDPVPGAPAPASFFVSQNFPNPFNPTTMIRYGIPEASYVSVHVHNLLGQVAAKLFEGVQHPGEYKLHIEASTLSSGVYFCRVQAGSAVMVRRMMVLK